MIKGKKKWGKKHVGLILFGVLLSAYTQKDSCGPVFAVCDCVKQTQTLVLNYALQK